MITSDTSGLAEFCGRDVFGTRIAALHKAYEGVGGAEFFTQRGTDGHTLAAISNVGGAVTLCCTDSSDLDELSAFIRFTRAENVLCDGAYGEKFGLKRTGSGNVVEVPSNIKAETDLMFVTNADEAFSYKGIFDTLGACDFAVGNFSDWLADISLRVRRGTAEMVSVSEDGIVAATASALFITESAVLLGAVGTLPPFRGKGYAGALVRSLAQKYTAGGRRTELLCEAHRLSFYKSIGFRKTGQWFAGTVL